MKLFFKKQCYKPIIFKEIFKSIRFIADIKINSTQSTTPKMTRMDHERNIAKKRERLSHSNFIKDSQWHLRLAMHEKGGEKAAEEVWEKRVENKEFLKEYANHMHKLATEHWTRKDLQSRVDWIYCAISKYYYEGGMEIKIEKEERKVNHFTEYIEDFHKVKEKLKKTVTTENGLKVLDVGSCYNPFKVFKDLDITAIDLWPAVPEVKQCDFLKLSVVEARSQDQTKRKHENSSGEDNAEKRIKKVEPSVSENQNDPSDNSSMNDSNETLTNEAFVPETIHEMEAESFDAIVFSLFISYIPSPHLRFQCCKKAYELLKPNGILCIVTPDSRSLNTNVHIVKLWKVTLGFLGFQRIQYEKHCHFHGMVFRKAMSKDVWAIDAQKDLNFLRERNVKTKFKNINYEDIKQSIWIAAEFSNKPENEELQPATLLENFKAKVVESIGIIKKKLNLSSTASDSQSN